MMPIKRVIHFFAIMLMLVGASAGITRDAVSATAQPVHIKNVTSSSSAFRAAPLNDIEGGDSYPFSAPSYIASIMIMRGKNVHTCTGIVISRLFVLTAAHCVADSKPADISVLIGQNLRLNRTDPGWIKANNKFIYEGYRGDRDWKHDLALIELKVPFSESGDNPAMPLYHAAPVLENMPLQMINMGYGFGKVLEWASGNLTEFVDEVYHSVQGEGGRLPETPQWGIPEHGDSGGPVLIPFKWMDPHLNDKVFCLHVGSRFSLGARTFGMCRSLLSLDTLSWISDKARVSIFTAPWDFREVVNDPVVNLEGLGPVPDSVTLSRAGDSQSLSDTTCQALPASTVPGSPAWRCEIRSPDVPGYYELSAVREDGSADRVTIKMNLSSIDITSPPKLIPEPFSYTVDDNTPSKTPVIISGKGWPGARGFRVALKTPADETQKPVDCINPQTQTAIEQIPDDGKWACQLSEQQVQLTGFYEFKASVEPYTMSEQRTHPANNVVDSVIFQIKRKEIKSIKFTLPEEDVEVADTYQITGTAEPGSIIKVYLGDKLLICGGNRDTVSAGADGQWRCVVPFYPRNTGTFLLRGEMYISQNHINNEQPYAIATREFRVTRSFTLISPPKDGNERINSGDNFTFKGTAVGFKNKQVGVKLSKNDKPSIYDKGCNANVADDNGFWECTVSSITNDSQKVTKRTVLATVEEADGTLTALTRPRTASLIVEPAYHLSITSPAEQQTVSDAYFVAGTGDAGSTVEVFRQSLPGQQMLSNGKKRADGQQVCSATVSENSEWSCGVQPAPADEGTYALVATESVEGTEVASDTVDIRKINCENENDQCHTNDGDTTFSSSPPEGGIIDESGAIAVIPIIPELPTTKMMGSLNGTCLLPANLLKGVWSLNWKNCLSPGKSYTGYFSRNDAEGHVLGNPWVVHFSQRISIDFPKKGQVLGKNENYSITGQGIPGETIEVTVRTVSDNNKKICSAQADKKGLWSCVAPALPEGTVSLSATPAESRLYARRDYTIEDATPPDSDVSTVILQKETDGQPANGVSQNKVTVVTLNKGMSVSDARVTLSVGFSGIFANGQKSIMVSGNEPVAFTDNYRSGEHVLVSATNDKHEFIASKIFNFSAADIRGLSLSNDIDGQLADGKHVNQATAIVTPTPYDVAGAQVIFTLTGNATFQNGAKEIVQNTLADNTATVQFTSTAAGSVSLRAQSGGGAETQAFTFEAPDLRTITLQRDLNNQPATGTDKNEATVTVGGVPVDTPVQVTFRITDSSTAKFDNGAREINTWTGHGKASVSLRDSLAEVVTVRAEITNSPDKRDTALFSFVSVDSMTLSKDIDERVADGKTSNQGTFTVLRHGEALQDALVRFTLTGAAQFSDGTQTKLMRTTTQGQSTVLFTDKKTEAVTLTAAVVNGEPDKSASQTFRFGGNFSSSVSLSKEADGEIADGITENRVRIKVIKISGEPEYDTAVKMTLSPSLNATFDNNSKEKVVYTDVNGEVVAGFKDRYPEAVTLMAELNDQPASAKSETFTFSLVTRVADIIKVDNESSCKPLDVNEFICGITLQLLNKAGGVVPDTDVALSVSQGATLTPPDNVRSDSSGKIRARVELTRSASITAGVEDYFSKTLPVR